MWKSVVDRLNRNEKLWQQHCIADFPQTYETARNKSRPGLSWYNLYRSLSLWTSLVKAAEEREEFALATKSFQEIRNFKILNNGVIGVLKKGCIVYYDIETLELSQRPPMMGDYAKYTETDTVIVILGTDAHLIVIRKVERTVKEGWDDRSISYNNVKQFTLTGEELYFVNRNNDVFVVYLCCRKLHAFYILRSLRTVMTIGYSDGKLNILTVQREIYSVETGNTCVMKAILDANTNVIQQLQKFQFLENMDWRLYFQCMCIWNQAVPTGPLQDMVSVRQHGDVFFVGSYWGVLRIYYAPFTDDEFDIFNKRPIKQYNFIDSGDRRLSICPILNVDVMEENDGHKVIIAMPCKITVINFKHNFKTEVPRRYKGPMLAEIPEHEEIDLNAPSTSRG
ncbi:hypothetical protein PYW07_000639 [Mythimna separata]|uniref:Uncharacterized protein n=1 Tax=Mythimna separata TaxID=271217 RepID=A0AAD7Z488_MYTSE|nr:hypothetical protein PYW07_000639 [Mythimna separata]